MKKTIVVLSFCVVTASLMGEVNRQGGRRGWQGWKSYNQAAHIPKTEEIQILPTEDDGYQKIEGQLHAFIRGDSLHKGGAAEGTSTNWSGYVAANSIRAPKPHTVDAVSGTWIVPALSPTSANAYSSIWVGIDGFGSQTVEQIGTEHDWVDGAQQNYAWFEMYPKGSYKITNFPVDAGDQISASVKFAEGGVFHMTIINRTKRVTTHIPVSYTTAKHAPSRASAEWIVEAPSTSQGILPLANFVSATFTNCSAVMRNIDGAIHAAKWGVEEIMMEDSTGRITCVPTALSSDGKSFSVAYH